MEKVELYLKYANEWLEVYKAFGKETSKRNYIVWLAKASAIALEYRCHEKREEIEELLMQAIYS